jgi:hypothetical protein
MFSIYYSDLKKNKKLPVDGPPKCGSLSRRRSFVLPPFQNIRCFSFVKQIYLDIF